MPDTLNALADRLLINDPGRSEIHLESEPLLNDIAQDLRLYVTHDLDGDRAGEIIPADMQHRLFLFQRSQCLHESKLIHSRFRSDGTGHDRRYHLLTHGSLRAKAVPDLDYAKPAHGDNITSLRTCERCEFDAGILADPAYFFFDNTCRYRLRCQVISVVIRIPGRGGLSSCSPYRLHSGDLRDLIPDL